MQSQDTVVAVREVEVKYRVDKDPSELLAAVARAGITLSAPVRQDDQAYAPVGWTYGQSKIGVPFARLRTQNGRHLFTVKRPMDNAMACWEHDTEVADREQMHHALVLMGFYPTVRIIKTRRTGVWGDASLCIDDVEHIGRFLELERLVSASDSAEAVQQQLDHQARSLGIDLQRTNETYDSLLRGILSSPVTTCAVPSWGT